MRRTKAKIVSVAAAGLLAAGIGATVVAVSSDSGSSTNEAFMCSADSCYRYGQIWPGSGAYWDYPDNWSRW
ncbi:hypothetical protein ACQHIV_38085 [Kribbella sp. GL6]|uniref:hypothetical protein n=1 Tax=Kribbella sp. GL6 TaxID=3419765 RepID=UPI003CFE5437